jgi:ribosomal protein S18 acetylase RimI-like enzyme
MIDIREADKSDYSIISSIVNETWKVAYKGLIPESDMNKYADKERREKVIADSLDKGEVKFYIAKYNDVDCAVSSFKKYNGEDFEDCAYIIQLYVLPDYQKSGIGKALIQYVHDTIINMGYKRVLLDTLEKNTNARAFYENLGYEYIGSQQSPDFSEKVMITLYKKELL